MGRNFWRVAGAVAVSVVMFAATLHAATVTDHDSGTFSLLLVLEDDVLNLHGTASAHTINNARGTVNVYEAAAVENLNNSITGTSNIYGDALITSIINYNAGLVNISGGTVGMLTGRDTSVTNVSGGTVQVLLGQSGSSVNISGGTTDLIQTKNFTTVTITGGSHSVLQGDGLATYHIYGANLALTSIGTDATWRNYLLTGTLMDGTNLDAIFQATDFYNLANVHLHDVPIVPAPATGWIALSLLGLLGRRSQRSAR